MSLFRVQDLSVSLAGRPVLEAVSLDVGAGEFVGIIGPNGAGKTTLMRAALGLVPADGESSLGRLARSARARHVAWMPQDRSIAWPISVEALVMLGRLPHRGAGRAAGAADRAQVAEAIRRVGLQGFEARAVTKLSSGERNRALIARALAQQTPLILADEPIAGLDPAHQIGTMETFAELAGDGRAVVLSIHDLGLAARHCTRLVLLGEQRVVADGPPARVLTPDNLARIFGIEAYLSETEHGLVYHSLRVLAP